jgi:hypothetical protein
MVHPVSMDVKKTRGFCDEVYNGLTEMKKKASALRDHVHEMGADNDVVQTYERHLGELIDAINWKIQILAHSCPHDWKGSEDFESDVQVDASQERDKLFSPGYTGG